MSKIRSPISFLVLLLALTNSGSGTSLAKDVEGDVPPEKNAWMAELERSFESDPDYPRKLDPKKITLFYLTFKGCGFCTAFEPALKDFLQRNRKDVQVVMVILDEEPSVRKEVWDKVELQCPVLERKFKDTYMSETDWGAPNVVARTPEGALLSRHVREQIERLSESDALDPPRNGGAAPEDREKERWTRIVNEHQRQYVEYLDRLVLQAKKVYGKSRAWKVVEEDLRSEKCDAERVKARVGELIADRKSKNGAVAFEHLAAILEGVCDAKFPGRSMALWKPNLPAVCQSAMIDVGAASAKSSGTLTRFSQWVEAPNRRLRAFGLYAIAGAAAEGSAPARRFMIGCLDPNSMVDFAALERCDDAWRAVGVLAARKNEWSLSAIEALMKIPEKTGYSVTHAFMETLQSLHEVGDDRIAAAAIRLAEDPKNGYIPWAKAIVRDLAKAGSTKAADWVRDHGDAR